MTAATLYAFVRRDQLIMSSYRFAFVSQLGAIAAIAAGLYFVGQVLLGSASDAQQAVAGISVDYFDYLFAGFAFTDVLTFGLSAFPRAIQSGQSAGTLEPMLLAHSRLFPLVVFSSVHGFLISLFRLLVYVLLATLVFGMWHGADLPAAAVVFVVAVVTFASLGALSTAFILVLKRGDPIVGLYAAVAGLLGGALFPISMLPDWLQPFAGLVPLTHALNGMRLALHGAPLFDVLPEVGALLLMDAVFLPAAVFAFNWALNRAKREGSLVQY